MDVFNGAEVCELVRDFLLRKLSEKYERKNLALYNDDGLVIFNNSCFYTETKTTS